MYARINPRVCVRLQVCPTIGATHKRREPGAARRKPAGLSGATEHVSSTLSLDSCINGLFFGVLAGLWLWICTHSHAQIDMHPHTSFTSDRFISHINTHTHTFPHACIYTHARAYSLSRALSLSTNLVTPNLLTLSSAFIRVHTAHTLAVS